MRESGNIPRTINKSMALMIEAIFSPLAGYGGALSKQNKIISKVVH
jgi:hypothetical protein